MVGLLLSVDSKEFVSHFIYDEILEDYYFISVSEAISIANEKSVAMSRVSCAKSLFPPPELINLNVNNNTTDYYNAYMRYLASPDIFPTLLTIVRALLNNMNVVLVYSDDDLQSAGDFTQLIGMYIENTFGLKLYDYKFYKDNKEECSKQPSNMDDIMKNFYEAVDWAKTHKSEKQIKKEKERVKEELEEQLKEMSSKELKKICKEVDVIYDKSLSKKQIRKAIIKKVLKRIEKKNKK